MEKIIEGIELKFNYNYKDIKKALFYYINNVNKLWVVFLCFTVLIVGIVFCGIIKGFSEYLIGLILVFLLIMLVIHAFFYRRPINSYLDFYRKRKYGIYIFSERGIRAIGEEVESTIVWSAFKKAYDIPNAIILKDEDKFLYIFPKKCFKDEKDIKILRQLLAYKIRSINIYA